jgi:hypothetical protein
MSRFEERIEQFEVSLINTPLERRPLTALEIARRLWRKAEVIEGEKGRKSA